MSSAHPTPPESLFAVFLTRLDAGEALAFEDFVRAHPGQADELRALHEDWREVDALLRCAAPGGMGDLDSARASLAPAADRGEVLSSRDLLDLFRAESVAGGRYRFRSVVGRGGMGVVLKVWDRELHRPLAMKAMLPGGRSSDASIAARPLARFLEEAQVTAQLDHPGIVPVHEVGTDAAGRPYFTMKLVEGESFLEVIEHVHARRLGWSLVRAVDILVKVCEALAYAHSRGVVHRDIKPANVMVGRFGEVYLMDWGCARLLNDDSPEAQVSAPSAPRSFRRDLGRNRPDSPLQSRDGDVIGTPAYMPPEQARGRMDLVGVPSDVYALGALLQHLLCGRAPFDEVVDASPYEVWRRVVDGPEPAWHAGALPMPDELVAIARKAMSREPELRYAGAQDLARELRAWLEGRVVGALESGTWAETRKWVGRNRALAGSLAATLLVSLAGAAAFAVQAREERGLRSIAIERQRDAEVATDVAKARTKAAEESNARLSEMLQLVKSTLIQADPILSGQRDRRVVDAMHEITHRLKQGALSGDPASRAELHLVIGEVLLGNGDEGGALDNAQKAAALLADQPLADPDIRLRADLLRASAWLQSSRYPEAQATYLASLAALEGAERSERAEVLNGVGQCEYFLGAPATALGRFEEAQGLLERLGLQSTDVHHEVVNNRALCLGELGRLDEAEALTRDLVERMRVLGASRDATRATYINNLGVLLNKQARLGEAAEAFADATAIWELVLGPDHPRTAMGHFNAGSLLLLEGRVTEAHDRLTRARAGFSVDRGTPSENLARCLEQLASCERHLGRMDAAVESSRAGVDMFAKVFALDHPQRVSALRTLGATLHASGRFDEALEVQAEALEMQRRLAPEDPLTARVLVEVGQCLLDLGDEEGASTHAQEARAMAQVLGPDARLPLAGALELLAACQRTHPELASSARVLAHQALEIRLEAEANDPEALAFAQGAAGTTCFALGDMECAIGHFEEAVSLRSSSRWGADGLCSRVQSSLAKCMVEAGRFEEALAVLRGTKAPRAPHPTEQEDAADVYLEARCLWGMGRIQEARATALRARDRLRELVPEGHESRERAEALVLEIGGG